MSPDCVAVLCYLEDRMRPSRAPIIAIELRMSVEAVYAALVRLYDLGLARIARRPVTGEINGWEMA